MTTVTAVRDMDARDLEQWLVTLRTQTFDIEQELMRRREEGARKQQAERDAWVAQPHGPGSLSGGLAGVKWL